MSTASARGSFAKPRKPVAKRSLFPRDLTWTRALELAIPGATTALSVVGIVIGFVSLATNSLEDYAAPVIGAIGVCGLYLFFYAQGVTGAWDRRLAILFGACLLATAIVIALPNYFTFLWMHGVISRSLVSTIILLAAGTVGTTFGVFYLLGATPTAEDHARYPILVVPLVVVLAAYAVFIGNLLLTGLPKITWEVLSQPYINVSVTRTAFGDDGWPTFFTEATLQPGLLTYIEGTALLVLLTSLISLPIGIGTGVYLAEYAGEKLGQLLSFVTTALRAISVLILGITALTIATTAKGTVLSDLFAGYYLTPGGYKQTANGTYVTAALVLSMLVIPIIARATEEGCRSLPKDIREGSLGLGATEGFTLTHLILPWSLPNIVTGLLLGAAEAAGSVAVLLFIAGTGQTGVGPLNQVTSLAYLVFGSQYGNGAFKSAMGPYQFSAGVLLLIITMGLSASGLVLKRQLMRRFRGNPNV